MFIYSVSQEKRQNGTTVIPLKRKVMPFSNFLFGDILLKAQRLIENTVHGLCKYGNYTAKLYRITRPPIFIQSGIP